MIRMVVFDMAGTTVNEHNVVYKMVREAVNDQGFDFSLEAVLEAGAGKEKLQAIKSVLALKGVDDDVLAAKMFAAFNVKLDSAYQTQPITGQPGATALFHALKNKGIAVVLNTGYNRKTAEGLVEKIGWKKGIDFDQLVTASDVQQNRPQPDMILLAMREQGIENGNEVIKVGDSAIDIEEGKNAGCRASVGITTGAHTVEQLQSAQPEFIIHHLEELLPVLEQLH